MFSDWHYGMVTDNIFNTYNTDICKARVSYVVAQALERIKRHKCSNLNIIILGDAVHGACHVSARVASEELVADQIMTVSEIIAQSIEYLSRYVDHTNVYMTYGNHARTVQNAKDSIHRDNMERLVGWWLAERLKGNDVISVIQDRGNEFIVFDVAGHSFCASHGDLDGVKSSPRLLSTLMYKVYGVDVEYVLLGDKHHRESFDELGVTALLCGSLCGVDDYANGKRLYGYPSQLLLIVTPNEGVDAEYRLRCE